MNTLILKHLRKSRGITAEALGEAIGVSANAIYMYESGKREPRSAVLQKIAEYFSVPLDSLMQKDRQLPQNEPLGSVHLIDVSSNTECDMPKDIIQQQLIRKMQHQLSQNAVSCDLITMAGIDAWLPNIEKITIYRTLNHHYLRIKLDNTENTFDITNANLQIMLVHLIHKKIENDQKKSH